MNNDIHKHYYYIHKYTNCLTGNTQVSLIGRLEETIVYHYATRK